MKNNLFLTILIGVFLFPLASGCSGGGSSGHSASSAKAITAFRFTDPAAVGVINEADHTISVTVPYGTDLTGLRPFIIHTGTSISPGSGVARDFTRSVTYTVTAADGSSQSYVVKVMDTAKEITSFSFDSPAATGVIDTGNHTIAVTLPYGTVDVTTLIPTITHTGADISPGSGVVQDFTNPVVYTVTAGDGSTRDYAVSVNIALNPAKEITSFSFGSPSATGVIDEVNQKIAVTLPYGTIDITALTPSIIHTGVGISPGSGVVQDFTGPVVYSVTAEDGSSKDYTVTVSIEKPFVSVWDTAYVGPDSSASNQVKLPLESEGTYNFMVYWGDGTNSAITAWDQAEVTHTYASEGIYTITIAGTIIGWCFNNSGDPLKLLEIQKWGILRLGNTGAYFYGCGNLIITADETPDLTGTTRMANAFRDCGMIDYVAGMAHWDMSGITDMSYMFYNATSFNQDIGAWDVSNVTDMSYIFYNASSFDQAIGGWNVSSVTDMRNMFCLASAFNRDISGWDVSNVTNMSHMFRSASSFNQAIGGWNVSSVTDMGHMFRSASAFNQDISAWNVSNVKDMAYMFRMAFIFNQDIGGWDVSNVTDMSHMFRSASSFNQDIGSWVVSNVVDMGYMFHLALSFNQDISGWNVSNVLDMNHIFYYALDLDPAIEGWNVSNVTDMSFMFYGLSNFNRDISGWDVSRVTNMSYMFYYASSFNRNIGGWIVSNVTDMSGMFYYASAFNQDISGWNVSNVLDMSDMFCYASSFKQDIGSWDVSGVTDMSGMFYYASSFNRDLGGWNVSNVIDMTNMFYKSSLTTTNYDSLLIGWSVLPLQSNVQFHAGNAQYSAGAAEAARGILTGTYGWMITDGGLE